MRNRLIENRPVWLPPASARRGHCLTWNQPVWVPPSRADLGGHLPGGDLPIGERVPMRVE
jgi:hypothetical protein